MRLLLLLPSLFVLTLGAGCATFRSPASAPSNVPGTYTLSFRDQMPIVGVRTVHVHDRRVAWTLAAAPDTLRQTEQSAEALLGISWCVAEPERVQPQAERKNAGGIAGGLVGIGVALAFTRASPGGSLTHLVGALWRVPLGLYGGGLVGQTLAGIPDPDPVRCTPVWIARRDPPAAVFS